MPRGDFGFPRWYDVCDDIDDEEYYDDEENEDYDEITDGNDGY